MALFHLTQGTTPLLVNVPHAGTHVPASIFDRLQGDARDLPDTDWFVDELYGFAADCGAGMMVATHSRYVVDLNRPPDDQALYATRTTGLVPVETFDGAPLYRPGQEPGPKEISDRTDAYWLPYHEVLNRELQRLRQAHGFSILLDAHSIRGEVPALFDGVLPDLNLGSNGGKSADSELISGSMRLFETSPERTAVLDGRFRGGYNTRHYGRPIENVHALQMEMPQRLYMNEQPPGRNPARAAAIQPLLRQWVEWLASWRPGP